MADLSTVTRQAAIGFLNHAFRNVRLSRLSADDLEDIRRGLASFVEEHAPGSWRPIAGAPRDRTVVIAEAGRPERIRSAEWWPSRQRWVVAVVDGATDGDLIFFRGTPTHFLDVAVPDLAAAS